MEQPLPPLSMYSVFNLYYHHYFYFIIYVIFFILVALHDLSNSWDLRKTADVDVSMWPLLACWLAE